MAIETTLDRAMRDAAEGRLPQAIDAVRLALRRSPDHPVGLRVLGMLLLQAGEHEQALHQLRRAVASQPRAPDVHSNLGNAYSATGRFAESAAAYRKALELLPDFLPALHGLSGVLIQVGDAAGALAAGDRAAELRRDWLELDLNRVDAFDAMDRHDRAMAMLEELKRRHPFEPTIRARILQLMNYAPLPAEAFTEAFRDYARCIVVPPAAGAFDRNPDRPLRLGILSPDLRTHSVAFFLDAPTRHIPADWHVVAFSASAPNPADPMTRMLKERIREWVDVGHLAEPALDAVIRQRRIDVLVDLAGHSAGNRLRALDQRPAPLIVTAIGHPSSTGHPAIDVRLVDSITDPPGTDAHCTERLQRMDPCFLCYVPPADAPAPAMPAADVPVTFGSFNLSGKVGVDALRLWRGALDAVPGSRLLLKARSLGDPAARESMLERIRAAGIDESRVEILAFVKGIKEHLELYARVHVALDPAPYSGTTTTCEALWMGVPVVTLPGERHASRVSASLLHAAGFGELVAKDAADFARIAARCATDRAWATDFRDNARARMQASALMDSKAYAARFFGALRESWRVRCEQAG